MSDSTEILIDTLRQWPRRAVNKALDALAYKEDVVLDATLENFLTEQAGVPSRSRQSAEKPDPSAIGFFDANFPSVLRHIPDPPLVIYHRGNLDLLGKPAVAVVGARRATKLGRLLSHDLGFELAKAGLTVVSGLAFGIDAAAHQGALQRHAACVAVMGAGLDQIYPKTHTPMANRILQNDGLLLSEYPGSYPPLAYQFPERNRIISGLSNGVVVVEAGLRSGSLITARLALEQGREVFAYPGPVTSAVSKGCHSLIRQGAELVTKPAEVMESLGLALEDGTCDAALSADQQYLMAFFQGSALTVDELQHCTGWSADRVMAEVGSLKLMGIVHSTAQGYIASP